MTPIALGIDVAQIKTVLLASVNVGYRSSDFASDESRTTSRGFMVEKDPIAGKHVVRFTIIDDNPVRVEFGNTIR